ILATADFTENNEFLDLPFSKAEINSGALTGTAGVSYNPNKTLQLRANISTAFRAPNIDDIGKVFDSEPGSVVVPNPNIKPEYAYGADFGLRLDLNKRLIFDTSVYYTYLDDALVRRDFSLNGETEIDYDGELSTVQAIQNASMADIYGLELGLRYNISSRLHLSSQYNIIRGSEDEDGEEVPVRHVAPDFGNTHLVFQTNRIKLDAFAVYNAEFEFSDLALSEREKDFIYALDENGNPYSPSWITFNIRTEYQFTEDLSILVSLENITDQRYRTYSSGISAPGRNLILSLNYLL
ncbi:MAG: TonB-dependent receptor, partial [Flavobacteriaceae bacterium]|nr:TonB-dependent receptor [Flavobacteriaceae bacterium]